ncbi:MAG: EamA family transporter [Candidatus Woesebacteria bacterium]|nr:MAG: EamA family transporter [Candidatus Woesebacteria bacterium]
MSWQFLIGISILLYSVSVLLQRVLLKDDQTEPISFSIFFQIGVATVIGILVLVIRGGIPIPDLSQISWSVLVMTALYALANIFIFKSLKTTEASRFTVIFSSKTLFAVLGSSLIFREGLTSAQWAGAILIVMGVIVIAIKDLSKKINKGDIFALFAAVMFGLANTNDRFLVQFFDPYSYVVIGFLLPGVAIALFYPKKLINFKIYFKKAFVYKMVILCLLYGLAAVTFFAALQATPNSSQLFSINSFGAILAVVFSIIFLKETDKIAKKILGAVISVAGLLLVNK